MAVGDALCVSWLSNTSTNTTFLSKATTPFLTCFCRVERQKYTEKKSCLNRGSNSNHQVMSPTCSPLSHLGGACKPPSYSTYLIFGKSKSANVYQLLASYVDWWVVLGFNLILTAQVISWRSVKHKY